MIEIGRDPIAFLNVRWYGVMVALAIVVIILWVSWQIKKGAAISYDTLFTAALVGIPSGVVISRLLHVIDRWDYYGENWGQIVGGGGLTIYGAVLGAALGVWVYSKFSKFKFAYIADLIAPGLILSQVVGRIGCTINGCCYGDACDLPWGIVYSHPKSLAINAGVVHPTQVYEIIYLLVIFGVIMVLKDRLRPHGSLFTVYLALYSLWRIGIDFIRDGTPFLRNLAPDLFRESDFFLLDFHQAQIIGVIVLIIAIVLLARKTRWVKAGEDSEGIESEMEIEGGEEETEAEGEREVTEVEGEGEESESE